MIAFKVLIGLLVILPGTCVLWAEKNTKFKNLLQEKLLENKDLFGGQHQYSTLVKWSGWQNVILGILILLPFPPSVYVGIFIGVCLGVYLYKVYLSITCSGKGGECANVDDRPIEGEVVGNANTPTGDEQKS